MDPAEPREALWQDDPGSGQGFYASCKINGIKRCLCAKEIDPTEERLTVEIIRRMRYLKVLEG